MMVHEYFSFSQMASDGHDAEQGPTFAFSALVETGMNRSSHPNHENH